MKIFYIVLEKSTQTFYLSLSAKCSAEGRVWVQRAYTQKATICLWRRNFFKQIAVAHSIFTLGGGVQLFWAAFDMPMTGIPLTVALGYNKLVFWAFKNKIMDIHLTPTCMIWAFWANKEWSGEITL